MLWSTYRAAIRLSILKDSLSESYRWTDDELVQYANWGLDDLEPLILSMASFALTGSGPEYALPADFGALNSIVLAENSTTIGLEPFDLFKDGFLPFITPDSTSAAGYMLDWPEEGKLYLSPARSSGYTLYYARTPTRIVDNNSMMPFERKAWISQALGCYIAYCAHLREGVSRAALEQWSQRPDLLVKNPLNAEAEQWFRAYKQLIIDHTRT